MAAFKDYKAEGEVPSAPVEEAAPKAEEAAKPRGGRSFPAHTILGMPALSPTMSQGAVQGIWTVNTRVTRGRDTV